MWVSIGRTVKYGLQNFWRNIGLSLTTIMILVLTLLSVNVFYVINVITDEAVKTVVGQVDVSVYFKPEITTDEAREVENYLKTFAEVKETTLLSQEEVTARFKEKHKNDTDILESIGALDTNPLPVTIIVKTHFPEQYEKVLANLEVAEYKQMIEEKTYDDHGGVIKKIDLITRRVGALALIVSGIFTVIAFLIIFNAMRVAIYSQREEISIKKLVGATNWFIRAPFLFDGLLFAFIAILITAVLVLMGVRIMDPYINVIFGDGFSLFSKIAGNAWQILVSEFVAVIILVGVSSAFAMRRHLRV